MNLRAFSIFFSYLLILNLGAKDFSDSELLEIGRFALQERAKFTNPEEKKSAFYNALKDLSDEQRIKAVFFRALDSENNPKLNMSNYYSVLSMLNSDSEWVKDWSLLRKMLREEKDPRRFYILSKMVPISTETQKHDFIAERVHMLFADGRVSKREGEYTPHYAGDVSKYAYSVITGNLRGLKAGFVSPPKKMSHEEQSLILAKWLKDNWPGCQDIEIPVAKTDLKLDQDQQPLLSQRVRNSNPKAESSKGQKASTQLFAPIWPFISGAFAFLILLGIWIKLKAARIGSG